MSEHHPDPYTRSPEFLDAVLERASALHDRAERAESALAAQAKPAAPRETRYELATEGQRNALARLQASYESSMHRAHAIAEDARAGLSQGLELLLVGMGAETKGMGVRVDGSALVLVQPSDDVTPPPVE